MAYIVFDITSITATGTTEPTGDGALFFYGAKFGTTGYWIRLPRVAPAIGECITTTPAVTGEVATFNGAWGLYFWSGTTSATYNWDTISTPMRYLTPVKITAFEKGGRWICLFGPNGTTPGTTAIPAGCTNGSADVHQQFVIGAFRKRLAFYYRSVAECGKPVQSTL